MVVLRIRFEGSIAMTSPSDVSHTVTCTLLPWSPDDAPCEHCESVYPSGVELFQQGEKAVAVYFLRDGLIKLKRSEASGHEIVVDLRFSGSIVGAAATISRASHPFTAATVTKCTVGRLSSEEFLNLLDDRAGSRRIAEMLSREVINQILRLSLVSSVPARLRLEDFLWKLYAKESQIQKPPNRESGLKLQLPLRQWEAAEFLSITPTYLSRLLAELEVQQVISRQDGWIVVRRPSSLWHAVEADR